MKATPWTPCPEEAKPRPRRTPKRRKTEAPVPTPEPTSKPRLKARTCRVCGKKKSGHEFYTNREVCRSCFSRKEGLRYMVRTRFRDGGSFVCKQCGKLRTAEQASTYAENLCRLCHASNLLLRKETAKDYLLCRSCGQILPKKDFAKYSITKCRACAAKETKLRLERRRQNDRT